MSLNRTYDFDTVYEVDTPAGEDVCCGQCITHMVLDTYAGKLSGDEKFLEEYVGKEAEYEDEDGFRYTQCGWCNKQIGPDA